MKILQWASVLAVIVVLAATWTGVMAVKNSGTLKTVPGRVEVSAGGWGFDIENKSDADGAADSAEETAATPTPRIALVRDHGAGVTVSIDLSTRCFGLSGPDLSETSCHDAYEPLPGGLALAVRRGALFDAVEDPATRYAPPVQFWGFYNPIVGGEPPWIFNYPVLHVTVGGSQPVARMDIVVSRSAADGRAYVQIFQNDVDYGMVSIFNQGSAPITGGVIEYDLIPISARSQPYDPDEGESAMPFGTRRCPPSHHRELSFEQTEAFLRQTTLSDRGGRSYRYREQIPAFEEVLYFAPLQNMIDAAPELSPIAPQLAAIWRGAPEEGEKEGTSANEEDPGSDDNYSVVLQNAFLASTAAPLREHPRQVIQDLSGRCVPLDFLLDARLTLHTARGGRAFTRTTPFRAILRFTYPDVGAPLAILDFRNAAAFRVEGENYRIRRALGGAPSFDMMLFARESSEHEFHLEAIAADGGVLWSSEPMSAHLLVPGHAMRAFLQDGEIDVPDYVAPPSR